VVKEGSFRGEGTIDCTSRDAEETPKKRPLPLLLTGVAGRVWLQSVVQAEGRRGEGRVSLVDFGLEFECGQEQENVHTGSEW
jgi:hypothetical protein